MMANQAKSSFDSVRKAINWPLAHVGLLNRTRALSSINSLSGIGLNINPTDALNESSVIDVLKRHLILEQNYTGDLAGVQMKDLRATSRNSRFENAMWELGEMVTDHYDSETHQIPDGLSGMPNLTRILVGLQMDKQAKAMKSQKVMQESLKLAQGLVKGQLNLTNEIFDNATKILAEARNSLDDISNPEVKKELERMISLVEEKLIKWSINRSLTEQDLRELGQVMAEINDIASSFRVPNEPESPSNILKYGSVLSQALSIGFIGSILVLGHQSGYTNLDRSFYWVATASLGLYAWMASNFMQIMHESEGLNNLAFPDNKIDFKDLPREITKRFSNGGFPGGISALLQDFYLSLVFGNHDVVLNNDPNNSFFQGTYGDAREVWRIEKRTALFEKVLQQTVPNLNPVLRRKIAGLLSMGVDREVPSHYVLLDASQEAGLHLGKVTKLLFKIGEKGGEYASLDAFSRMIEDRITLGARPSVRKFFNDRIVPITDRLGLKFFLSDDFNDCIIKMAEEESLDKTTLDEILQLFQYKKAYARQSLIAGAKASGIDQARAEKWADTYIKKLRSEGNYSELGEKMRALLYKSSSEESEGRIAQLISDEFGINIDSAKSFIASVKKYENLEHDARVLNGDFDIPVEARARMRDLANIIMFNERTGDERVHEEGNVARIVEEMKKEASGFVATLATSLPGDFFKNRKGSMSEKLFLSFVARGIGEKTSQILVDKILAFAAQEYAKRFSAENWTAAVKASKDPWWITDYKLLNEYIQAVNDEILSITSNPQSNGIENLSQEKTARILDLVLSELKLHQGILERTTDGYVAQMAQNAEGIIYVSSMIGGLKQAEVLQAEVKKNYEELLNRKNSLAKALFGNDDEATLKKIEPIISYIDWLVNKGIGVLRAEGRFQDGHLLSFDSLATQIGDVLFGNDSLRRTMLSKKSRYQKGKFKQFEILAEKDKPITVPVDIASAFKGLKDEAKIRFAIALYVSTKSNSLKNVYKIEDLLRDISRSLSKDDARAKKIKQLKGSLVLLKNNGNLSQEAKTKAEEILLRRIYALESQINMGRDRVEESTIIPFANIIAQEMGKDDVSTLGERIKNRAIEIYMGMIKKESQVYGLQKNGQKLLPALEGIAKSVFGNLKKMESKSKLDHIEWQTCIFFERMNYEKWKGSKGANNDSGLGFYLGERLGVKLYQVLEYMTKDKIMLPPDILARLHRNVCDKIKLSGNVTEDQRIKEEKGIIPEQIALKLIDAISNNIGSQEAAKALIASWGLDKKDKGLCNPVYAIAEEIAIRLHGHRVIGYVSAKAALAHNHSLDETVLPKRAQEYIALVRKFKTLGELLSSMTLTETERNALVKEAKILNSRFKTNRKIIAEVELWFNAHVAKLGAKPAAGTEAYELYMLKVKNLEEEMNMRMDRLTLFHPDVHWYLIPAMDQPRSGSDRLKQFVGEKLQKRRREFIIPGTMTAEEIAIRMITMANNRMPMKKIERGIVEDYGKAFLDKASAIDKKLIATHPDGILGEDLEEIVEEVKDVAEYLDTNRFERPIELERDAVRDVDTDNFLFESSQFKANAYWQKRNGKILRSYAAILQTQQFYPETDSRLSSTQNLMGVLYSTVLGKAYGKRGKQVIMGCYIVKNRKALAEAVDWIEIPMVQRQEDDLYEEGLKFSSSNVKDAVLTLYRKKKILSEFTVVAATLGAGGAIAFSGVGIIAAIAAGFGVVGITKFALTKDPFQRFTRFFGYGLLASTVSIAAIAIGAGLWAGAIGYIPLGIAMGLFAKYAHIKTLSLSLVKEDNLIFSKIVRSNIWIALKNDSFIDDSGKRLTSFDYNKAENLKKLKLSAKEIGNIESLFKQASNIINANEIYEALKNDKLINGAGQIISLFDHEKAKSLKSLALSAKEIKKIQALFKWKLRIKSASNAIVPVSSISMIFVNPLIAAGMFNGAFHFDDLRHLPYFFSIDTKESIARIAGKIGHNETIRKWWSQRQKLVRTYEEEEVYSQPDDVEDFGSSPAVFQRGYHSDYHQSIDGISGDVKDKGTLDGQRGRWHGGMEGNFIPAVQAYFWDRQAMEDLDFMRYILQTLGPAGSFSRLILNVNLWLFLGIGLSAFSFGVDPERILVLLAACSGVSFTNYMLFMGLLRKSMIKYGSTWGKSSDMLGILDSLSPINVTQGIVRIRFGMTPPFLLTKTPHETVATPTGTGMTKLFPFPPFVVMENPKDEVRKQTNISFKKSWPFIERNWKEERLINSVVQARRMIWAYAVGSIATLTYSLPALSVNPSDYKAWALATLIFWTGVPIYYAQKGLSVVAEGSSPFGMYKSIQGGKKAGKPSKEVESARHENIKRGLNKSAFPEISDKN